MNIYDEAIETLKEVMYDLTRDENDNKGLTIYQIIDMLLSTKKVLERAKKVEEVLEYTKKHLDNYWKEVCILKPRLAKVEELLALYQKKENCIVCVPLMKDSNILHCVVRYSEDEKYMRILNQIKQLEEELNNE